jgi:hypothetical protein
MRDAIASTRDECATQALRFGRLPSFGFAFREAALLLKTKWELSDSM